LRGLGLHDPSQDGVPVQPRHHQIQDDEIVGGGQRHTQPFGALASGIHEHALGLQAPSHEIRDQYLDATKARDMLGWTPGFSFDAGLRATIDWYKEYFRG